MHSACLILLSANACSHILAFPFGCCGRRALTPALTLALALALALALTLALTRGAGPPVDAREPRECTPQLAADPSSAPEACWTDQQRQGELPSQHSEQ